MGIVIAAAGTVILHISSISNLFCNSFHFLYVYSLRKKLLVWPFYYAYE